MSKTKSANETRVSPELTVLSACLKKSVPTFKAKEGLAVGETERNITVLVDTNNKEQKEFYDIISAHTAKHDEAKFKTTWKGKDLPSGQYVATFRSKTRMNEEKGYETGVPRVGMINDEGIETVLSPNKGNGFKNEIPGFYSGNEEEAGDKMTVKLILNLATNEKRPKMNGTYLNGVIITELDQVARSGGQSIFDVARAAAEEQG